jgi:hypothetical protein
MNQQELFPVTVDDEPRQVRTGPTCKRKYLTGGEHKVCGHLRSQHHKKGDPVEIPGDDGPRLRNFTYHKTSCAECGCPEFQAREFRNPFLEKADGPRRVNSMTMCAVCRHAKRDHHRTGCNGMYAFWDETEPCKCKKFVNPFVAKTQEAQAEMFPTTPEEVKS